MAQKWSLSAKTLAEGVDILVTNFNKIQRLTREKKVRLDLVQAVVIDETDIFIEVSQTAAIVQLIQKV